MAEIVTGMTTMHQEPGHEFASNSKANAALTTGIIGTALAGLTAIGGMAGVGKLFNGQCGQSTGSTQSGCMTEEDLYLERKQAQNYIDITKEYYEGKLQGQRDLTNAFFESYKRDVDNSFDLYKYTRDENEKTNQRITDVAFNLYKNQRDEKDEINGKISALQSKVDIMQAIRPYQDALINAKIDNNALVADYNLSKRTCRMIEGALCLPNDLISGFTSYNTCNCGM